MTDTEVIDSGAPAGPEFDAGMMDMGAPEPMSDAMVGSMEPSDSAKPDPDQPDCGEGEYYDAVADSCIETCESDPQLCAPNAMCVATDEGPPECECKPGYLGDGSSCEPEFVQVALGENHACAVTSLGDMYCWGSNAYGQLGTGTEGGVLGPVKVPGTGWTEVGVGSRHTCGIRADHLLCWGSSSAAGLDDDTDARTLVPTAHEGFHWFGLSTGPYRGCALWGDRGTGSLYCFGGNDASRPWTPRTVAPQEVTPGKLYSTVALGWSHGCAIRSDGALVCWGTHNLDGQLGLGADAVGMGHVEPTVIGDDRDWVAVAVGQSTICATKTDGTLHCTGQGRELPTPAPEPEWATQRTVPTKQGSTTGWTALATGANRCGIRDGRVYCWGSNVYGEAGPGGYRSDRVYAQPVDDSTGWTSVTTEETSSCGIRDGRVYCWGRSHKGSLANEDSIPSYRAEPVRVGDEVGWTQVTTSPTRTCALRAGIPYCWGIDSKPTARPAALSSQSGWTDIAAFGPYAAAIQNGSIYSWIPETPVALEQEVDGWQSIALGDYGTSNWNGLDRCGIRSGAELYCWWSGIDAGRRLGDFAGPPQQVPGRWTSVFMGIDCDCGIDTGGQAWCWGDNFPGAPPGRQDKTAPVQVDGAAGWTLLDARKYRTICGIRDAELLCSGHGSSGFVPISPDNGWSDFSRQGLTACGIQGGDLWCWSYFDFYESKLQKPADLFVAGEETPWLSVHVSSDHTCGIRADRSLYCWGNNDEGQLGIGEAWTPVPLQVSVPTEP